MAKMSKKPRNEVKQRLRVFENNTILLIFSFLAAAAVWFAMMASNSESRATVIRNVPINVEISDTAQEAGVRVFSMSSSATDVSITGNSLITSKVTSEDIGVTGTLDPSVSMLTGSSLQQTTLSLRAAKKGNTLAEYEVESVSPSEITVVYDKYKETQLTLETNFQYTTAENYYAPSTPTLSTELITVSGPESSVNKVARAVLEYKFSEELTQSKSLSCKVTLYDANGNVLDPTELYLKLSDDTVEVSIPVTSRQTVKLEADVRNVPDSFASNRITIDPAEIEIAGDGETVSKYTTLTLSTPINFLDVTPENNTFTVAIPVPSGVTNVTRVENATVTFNLNGYKETSVLTSNISVINVPEGMEAELSTKTLTLKIIGTAAQISKLTGDSVFCTVDLSTVTDPSGSMEAPVTVTINNADSCWATGSYTAHVTLSPKTESSTSGASNYISKMKTRRAEKFRRVCVLWGEYIQRSAIMSPVTCESQSFMANGTPVAFKITITKMMAMRISSTLSANCGLPCWCSSSCSGTWCSLAVCLAVSGFRVFSSITAPLFCKDTESFISILPHAFPVFYNLSTFFFGKNQQKFGE